MFNIFNYAQDHNIKIIEDLDYWLMKKFKKIWRLIRGNNQLNEKRAENICRLMFNHVGINSMYNLGRCIGFGDDEDDFYYIIRESNGKIVWHSMVGAFITLKGRVTNWEYWSLDSGLETNGCPKEKEFLVLKEKSSLGRAYFYDVE